MSLSSPKMSTTNTATTLVAHDHIPGDEIELLNQMCVLVLTRGDGTLLDAATIQEDIIELCVEMGQTHPKVMLQFLVTKSVVLFCSGNEMLSWCMESPKSWFCIKNPLGFILLPLYHPSEGLFSSKR